MIQLYQKFQLIPQHVNIFRAPESLHDVLININFNVESKVCVYAISDTVWLSEETTENMAAAGLKTKSEIAN